MDELLIEDKDVTTLYGDENTGRVRIFRTPFGATLLVNDTRDVAVVNISNEHVAALVAYLQQEV